MNQILIGAKALGIVAGAYVCFMILRGLSRALGRGLSEWLVPIEARLLLWLQDRASARALGVDIGIVRARRKIDFPNQ